MSKIIGFAVCIIMSGLLLVGNAHAAGKDDAVAMVKKVVAAIKVDGVEKTYTAINEQADPSYKNDGIYPLVYTMDGKCLVHGANKKFVGRDLSGSMDTDGKIYGEERAEKAKNNG